jgi:hypothetical protein
MLPPPGWPLAATSCSRLGETILGTLRERFTGKGPRLGRQMAVPAAPFATEGL